MDANRQNGFSTLPPGNPLLQPFSFLLPRRKVGADPLKLPPGLQVLEVSVEPGSYPILRLWGLYQALVCNNGSHCNAGKVFLCAVANTHRQGSQGQVSIRFREELRPYYGEQLYASL